jgi:hypothetical protein
MIEPAPKTALSSTRRTFMLGAAGTMATAAMVAVASPASAASSYSVIAKLPGEVSRISNVVTTTGGKKLYENILVNINGDPARIFVPHSAAKVKGAAAVWFFHAAGSTHSALNSAFKYSAELVTDQGAISICQYLGGDTYTSNAAVQHQKNGYAYLKARFPISLNFLRSNSGGGAMACAAYGGKLIPNVRGLYLASSVYDMEKLYASDPARIGPAYGNSVAAVRATNPARLAASAWKSSNVRACLADPSGVDPYVPVKDHGGALLTKIAGVAKEASARYYLGGGHQVPSWVSKDMLSAFARWL